MLRSFDDDTGESDDNVDNVDDIDASRSSSLLLWGPAGEGPIAGPSVIRGPRTSPSPPTWDLEDARRRFLGHEVGAWAHYASLEAEQEELTSRLRRLQRQVDEVAQAIVAQRVLLQEMCGARTQGRWEWRGDDGKGKGKGKERE